MDRLKNLLLQEGVFLKGKKGTRDTDIFILDLLLEKVNELKKTKELLEIIKENSGMGDPGGDNSAVQYHSGAGTGPTVPCFLRHRGKVLDASIVWWWSVCRFDQLHCGLLLLSRHCRMLE